MLTMSI